MLKTSLSAMVLAAFLSADTALMAQWGRGWSGNWGSGWGRSQSSYYRGGYGNYWGGGNYGRGYYNRGYYGNYWGRGNYNWPRNWSYYGGSSYYGSPSYYSSPSYGWSQGTMYTQATVPSGQNALAYGNADEAALGVWISQTGPSFRVIGLPANSPAAQAGIRTGDVIHSIDGQQFNTARELIDWVGKKDVSDQVEIEFSRSGQRYAASMALSARAEAYGLSSQGNQYAGEGGQQYSVMRPATEGAQSEQLESEIQSLKQDVHQLRQDLHQLQGREGAEAYPSQRGDEQAPVPPTELQFDRTQQSAPQQFEQRGIEQQQFEQRNFEQRGIEQQQFEQRGIEQRGTEQQFEQPQFEQRGTDQPQFEQRNIEQRQFDEREPEQRQRDEQGTRTGV